MKKLLLGIVLALAVLASSVACTATRTATPKSPSSGENWATQRATQR